jgi:hypothetical protein
VANHPLAAIRRQIGCNVRFRPKNATLWTFAADPESRRASLNVAMSIALIRLFGQYSWNAAHP